MYTAGGWGGGVEDIFLKGQNFLRSGPQFIENFQTAPLLDQKKKWQTPPPQPSFHEKSKI